ncbi:MAG: hypothetical protein ACI4UE_06320 [Candidatus Scatovivens sp.]
MLAKQQKIQNILVQRAFIEEMLLTKKDDGAPKDTYAGYLYPENKKYFQENGFIIEEVESDILKALCKGTTTYKFIPNEEILELTEEDWEEAKKCQVSISNCGDIPDLGGLLSMLSGRL